MKQNPTMLNDYLRNEENISFRNLITAVSYEDRGFLSVKTILERFKIEKAVLILFGKNYLDSQMQEKWEIQKNLLNSLFNKYKIEYVEIRCDSIFFNESIDEIKTITKNKLPNIINITPLPKNYILRLAKEFDDEKNIFFYYRSTYREPSKEQLDISIERIIPVEGFEGTRELTAEDILVLILGYEGHRAQSFLSNFSPYKILPLISIPNEGDKEIDDGYYNNVLNCNWKLLRKHSVLKKSDGSFFTISSLNHLNFTLELKDIINTYKENEIDVCISPIGTKAQTLGLYLYWREHPDTQIIYSVPIKRFDVTANRATIKDIYPIPSIKTFDTNVKEAEPWIYGFPPKM